MTLTEFLLERFAEDERRLAFDGAHWMDCDRFIAFAGGGMPCTCGLERRLQADVEAKRRIVGRHHLTSWHSYALDADVVSCEDHWPCPDLRDLAAPYADHEDFDPAWLVADPATA